PLPQDDLQLLASLGAGGAEHLAALADHDSLLALPLHDDVGIDVDETVLALGHLLDPHGKRVRQLLPQPVEELLTHDLGHDLGLRLVGDHALRVVGRALLESADQTLEQLRDAVAGQGGHRIDLGERPLRRLHEVANDLRLRGLVHLVDRDNDIGFGLDEPIGDHPVTRADGCGGVDDEQDDVDLPEGPVDPLVEPVAELVLRLVETGCVDQDELEVLPGDYAADGVAGGLGAGRGYGDLGPDHLVDKCGLADVGPPDDGAETGSHWTPTAGSTETPTTATRRPCIRSTRNATVSRWKTSPTSGTRSARPSTRPPTVSHSSSGRSTPSTFSSSSTGVRASTSHPSSLGTIRFSTRSVSSEISPTSSSIRSSMVTRPTTSPYSSTTITWCWCCSRISLSRLEAYLVSGTNSTGRITSETDSGLLSVSPSVDSRSLTTTIPTTSPLVVTGIRE